MFQEGQDPAAKRTFSEIARLTGGAYSAFDAGASARLAALLRAAAAYAAGGHAALVREAASDAEARLLLAQMREREIGVVSPSAGIMPRAAAPASAHPIESLIVMNLVIGLILLFLLLQAIKQFGRMDAATAARIIRHGGGVVGMIGALLLLLRGRVGLAAAVAGMVANFAGWKTMSGAPSGFGNVGGGAAHVRDDPRSPVPQWWR